MPALAARPGGSIEIRNFLRAHRVFAAGLRKNVGMKGNVKGKRPSGERERAMWELARSGELRGAVEMAHKALDDRKSTASRGPRHVGMHLVCASCAMRQGDHAEAMRELEAAARASPPGTGR